MSYFSHLHGHSQFSLLDAMSRPHELFERVASIDQKAVAITDHGNSYGVAEMLKSAEKHGIKFIAGNEFYVAARGLGDRTARDAYHLTVLCDGSKQGWKNLCNLHQISFKNFYYNPLIDLDVLAQHSEGLIALSGCMGGCLLKAYLNGDETEAIKRLKALEQIFGKERFFIELQNHDLENDAKALPWLRAQAKKFGLKAVASNDFHYVNKDDWKAHDVLIAIGKNQCIYDPNRQISYEPEQFFIRDYDEMAAQGFSKAELEQSAKIADMCEQVDLTSKTFHIPVYAESPKQSVIALKQRVKDGILGLYDLTPEVIQRVKYEVEAITKAGFSDYMLIVADLYDFMRREGIPFGPGRGCLTGDSKVRMERSVIKELHDIVPGDYVIDHLGARKRVTAVHNYPILPNESLITVSPWYRQPLTMTADHKIWAAKTRIATDNPKLKKYRDGYSLTFDWIPASELKVGDWVFVPKQRRRVQSSIPIDLSEVRATNCAHSASQIIETVYNNRLHALSLHSIHRSTGVSRNCLKVVLSQHICAKPSPRHEAAKVKVEQYLNSHKSSIKNYHYNRVSATISFSRFFDVANEEDMPYWIGRWIGDGWLSHKKTRWGMAFNSEDRDGIDSLLIFLGKYGLPCSVVNHKTKRVVQVVVHSKIWCGLFSVLFEKYQATSQTKHIPLRLLELPNEKLLELLRGYFDADGHDNGGRYRFTTVSPNLAYQLDYCFSALGIPSSIKEYFRDYKHLGLTQRQVFTVSTPPYRDHLPANHLGRANTYWIREDGIAYRIRKIESKYGVGRVYDISVEDSHSYLSNFAVHNSVAGSIVAYALGITEVDPLHYGLLFERFINPERVSLPDVDMDISAVHRDKVIQYIRDTYGPEFTGQLITFQSMGARAAIRDISRACNVPLATADTLAKAIPLEGSQTKDRESRAYLAAALEMQKSLRQAYENDDKVKQVIDTGIRLEGTAKAVSKHAAGVVISDTRLADLVPMGIKPKGQDADPSVVGFEMGFIEDQGLIKFDALGLRNVDVVADCIAALKRFKVVPSDYAPTSIPTDDKATLDMLSRGLTAGVFQLESVGMRGWLRKLQPDRIEDIMAMVALYRPGPMEHIPRYVERKHGREKITYPHPCLEPILKETYGVPLYQEQLMGIGQKIAGWTLARADQLRKVIGKKIVDKIEVEKRQFIEDSVKQGHSSTWATDLFETFIEPAARYGFNKSHSCAYGLLAYQTAYLKCNYPVFYFTALLKSIA